MFRTIFFLVLFFTSMSAFADSIIAPQSEGKSATGKEKNNGSSLLEERLLEDKPIERLEKVASVPVPETEFYDEIGKPHTFEEFYGRPLVVNFWATWCTPCVQEMPDIAQLQKDYKRTNLKVLAISEDFKGADAVREFYKTNQLTNLGLYIDKHNALFNELQIVALPTSYIVDSKGKIVAKLMGSIDWEDKKLHKMLDKLTDGKEYPPEVITLKTNAAPVDPTPVTVAPPAPAPVQVITVVPKAIAPSKIIPEPQKFPAATNTPIPPEAVTSVPSDKIKIMVPPGSTVVPITEDSPQAMPRRPMNQPSVNQPPTNQPVQDVFPAVSSYNQ